MREVFHLAGDAGLTFSPGEALLMTFAAGLLRAVQPAPRRPALRRRLSWNGLGRSRAPPGIQFRLCSAQAFAFREKMRFSSPGFFVSGVDFAAGSGVCAGTTTGRD